MAANKRKGDDDDGFFEKKARVILPPMELTILPVYEDRIQSEFICAICSCLVQEPIQTPCFHIYCGKCAIQAFQIKSQCPTCRLPTTYSTSSPLAQVNPPCARMWGEILVYCPCHKDQGCPWQGPLANIHDHIRSTCNYQTVICEWCQLSLLRPAYEEHIYSCDYRQITCQQCGAVTTPLRLNNHILDECPCTIVSCLSFTIFPGNTIHY